MGTETVDLIDAWHDLYVMLGTSSAALVGLLFIATSMHLGEVVSNPGFRVRSYNQTLYWPDGFFVPARRGGYCIWTA
jgi:hypothetical protein